MFIKKYWLLILPLVLFLALRLTGLGTDMANTDELRWQRRSINFMEALKNLDLAKTYQHYQPGVTLMWLNSANLQINKSWPYLENSQQFVNIHRQSQITLVGALSVFFIIQLFLITHLYSLKTATIFGMLVAVEPYLIGIDRWVHLTSLETYAGFTSFLFLMWYLEKRSYKKIALIASAKLLAFAVLSKLTSFALLPIFVFHIIQKPLARKEKIKQLLIYVSIFFFVFIIVFPAMWIDPLSVLYKLFSAVTGAVSGDSRAQAFTGFRSLTYYFVILAYKLSPITFLLMLASFFNLRKTTLFVKPILITFIYMFFVLTLSDKKIDRYSIILFPYILLIVSLYLSKLKVSGLSIVFSLYLIFTVSTVKQLYPIYSNYYSSLVGGYKSALKNGYYENSGEFFSNAAFYLNTKDRNTQVFVPDNIETFKYFYKGKTTSEFNSDTNYVVSSVDFDRKQPRSEYCGSLEKQFGSVYVFRCY